VVTFFVYEWLLFVLIIIMIISIIYSIIVFILVFIISISVQNISSLNHGRGGPNF